MYLRIVRRVTMWVRCMEEAREKFTSPRQKFTNMGMEWRKKKKDCSSGRGENRCMNHRSLPSPFISFSHFKVVRVALVCRVLARDLAPSAEILFDSRLRRQRICAFVNRVRIWGSDTKETRHEIHPSEANVHKHAAWKVERRWIMKFRL